MQKKTLWKVLGCILACILLAFGGPILINSAYKYGLNHTPLFNTLWGADDALSYYGSVLGAAITALSLFFTIRFTRKQIQRESYLNRETEKWTRIEDTIGNILNGINPMPILRQEADKGSSDPVGTATLFQKYQISCRIATDPLMACVNTADYTKIEELVNHLADVSTRLVEASQKKVDQYTKIRQLSDRETAWNMILQEKLCPGSFAEAKIITCEKIMQETNEIRFEDIEKERQQTAKEFVDIYNTAYRPLLQLKGMTFESINSQIQANADKMLLLRRK